MRGNADPSPREPQFSQASAGPGLAEVLVVWGLFGFFWLFVLITYSHVAPHELYHVSRHGLAGGLSRLLVTLNYPAALAAIAVLALVVERLGRVAIWPALPAFCLCALIVIPGVVDENDLDARPINALPAIGVGLVLAMTVWAIREGRIGGSGDPRGDKLRLVVFVVLALVALPWIFSALGVYIGDIPLLQHVYRSKQVYQGHAAVHLGEHHGLHGLLLVTTALLLTRELPRMRSTRLRTALAIYLSLMIAYGIGNMTNDVWGEQIFERGWTDWKVPGMISPSLSWIWALTITAGMAIYLLFWRRRRLA